MAEDPLALILSDGKALSGCGLGLTTCVGYTLDICRKDIMVLKVRVGCVRLFMQHGMRSYSQGHAIMLSQSMIFYEIDVS